MRKNPKQRSTDSATDRRPSVKWHCIHRVVSYSGVVSLPTPSVGILCSKFPFVPPTFVRNSAIKRKTKSTSFAKKPTASLLALQQIKSCHAISYWTVKECRKYIRVGSTLSVNLARISLSLLGLQLRVLAAWCEKNRLFATLSSLLTNPSLSKEISHFRKLSQLFFLITACLRDLAVATGYQSSKDAKRTKGNSSSYSLWLLDHHGSGECSVRSTCSKNIPITAEYCWLSDLALVGRNAKLLPCLYDTGVAISWLLAA